MVDESIGERVIAQYFATKVTWWATYPRVLVVTASTLSTYNPETYLCTNQWELSEIEDVEIGGNPDQFTIRLERARFRSARVRFECRARMHLTTLLARLRRQYRFQPLRFQLSPALTQGSTPQLYYRCIEQFANGSYKLFLMQVTVCGIMLLDDCGRRVQNIQFMYLERVFATPNHPEGMVLTTAFQERLFLCIERNICIEEIVAAANCVGVQVCTTARSNQDLMNAINIHELRRRNNEILHRPSLVRFEVKKAVNFTKDGTSSESTSFKKIQIILQGNALVEVHRSMRTVVSWPYTALLAIVRPDWDPKRIVLEFARGESLSVRMESRDQLITLLLLAQTEAGLPLIPVCGGEYERSRFFHPHSGETTAGRGSSSAAIMSIPFDYSVTTFLLRRVIQTDARLDLVVPRVKKNIRRVPSGGVHSSARTRRSSGDGPEQTDSLHDEADTETTGAKSLGWFQRRVRVHKRLTTDKSDFARHSMDNSGMSMNDNVNILVAMEELNANLHFGDIPVIHCNHETLLKAIEVVVEHLVALVNGIQKQIELSGTHLSVTLQSLTRLVSLPGAFLSDGMIRRVFNATEELFIQQDSLTCYWCLKLIQALFAAERTSRVSATTVKNTGTKNGASTMYIRMPDEQRTKVLQYFVQQKEIQHSISDLLPRSFGESAAHSGYWMSEDDNDFIKRENIQSNGRNKNSFAHESLQTSEARVAANMNIVHHEALLTLHLVVTHLVRAERQQRTSMHQQLPNHARRHTRSYVAKNSDVPAAKQQSHLADKLLQKYSFIIDSVIDVRLTRSAEAPVALAKFLVVHFGGVVQPSRRRNSLVPANPVGSRDSKRRHGRRERRRNSIAAIAARESNQDTHEVNMDSERNNLEAQADALRHLRAFLSDYERKLHPVTLRSRLFRAQNTILAPLSTLSQQTASDDMNAILLSYRRECQLQNQAIKTYRHHTSGPTDDPLTIEHLIGDEIEIEHLASSRQRGRRRKSASESSLRNSFDDIDRHELCGSRIHSTVGKSSSLSLRYQNVESSSHAKKMAVSKRRRHSVASTHSAIKISDLSSTLTPPPQNSSALGNCLPRSEQEPGEVFLTESVLVHQGSADPTPPTASRRAMAHACDACIGCNDVCANTKCIFCAEKEYQVRLAFGGSAVARGHQEKEMRHPPQRVPPASTSMEQRQYSSCELRRHQSLRSCWVLVDGEVYDVTDLLGVHPGGAHVLLGAAQSGKDCAPVFANHPPAARQVLANYRLGKFYHCETRTVHQ